MSVRWHVALHAVYVVSKDSSVVMLPAHGFLKPKLDFISPCGRTHVFLMHCIWVVIFLGALYIRTGGFFCLLQDWLCGWWLGYVWLDSILVMGSWNLK